ncbi:MAG: 2-dehydro-3-deoxy-D-gluconate 5-dehydrogenase KduD [Alphaproteobacteria bacterium]|nr:2-dehydro-3-deoxy-D-gluconate 5-dehydrogenase KduD [Alphaproteobacteria bacterium]MBV8548360.1 2-dehydro-3-deoxy-D-gluconate 5-dehydrogenase KduD [Alphaproteobacteria bacterium]
MSLNPFDLSGRVALVTGANVGLGQAIALGLAEAGSDIIAVSRRPATETGTAVEKLGRHFLSIEADLTSTAPIQTIVDQSINVMGKIDILINNAGIIRRAAALDFTEQDWDDVMNVNIKSAFFLAQAVGRHMVPRGTGKIINIASMLSFQGGIRVPSYTASKSGIAGITRLLANEWASKGINVNAIAPGYMATDNTEALRNDPARNRDILARIPAGRWGDSADLAGAAVFLSSDAARYVHGVVLPVDGGWQAR